MKTLLIDDMRNIEATFVARTFDEGIYALINCGPFDLLFLDHDLGETDDRKTDYGIMNFLEANPEYKPKLIRIVSSNPVGVRQMQVVIDRIYGK